MSDITDRLTTSPGYSPSQCWSCGEWGCINSAGSYVPCLCELGCDCDNACCCNCHKWYVIVHEAKAEIERLRDELAQANNRIKLLTETETREEARDEQQL